MQDYLKRGDNVIDAGANTGLYSLLARSVVGEEGHIDAFEPNPKVAASLRQTIRSNDLKNIVVHELGVADDTSSAGFTVTGDDCTAHITANDESSSDFQIQLCRVDDTLKAQDYQFAKFDIEGYEPFAIRGLSKWTKDHNPYVMLIEMAGYSKQHGISTSDFIEELSTLAYHCYVYDPQTRKLERTDTPWLITVQNVLAIADSKLELVIDRVKPR